MSIRHRPTRSLVLVLPALFVSAILFGLALQQAIAFGLVVESSKKISGALANGDFIAEADLHTAELDYARALGVLPQSAQLQQDYGRLLLRTSGFGANGTIANNKYLEASSTAFRNSIVAAPNRPFPWSLAAYTSRQLQQSPKQTVVYLRYSYFLGPEVASSMLLRTSVAAGMWSTLPDDIRGYIVRDLEALWGLGTLRKHVIDLYLLSDYQFRIDLRAQLFRDPKKRRQLDEALMKVLVQKK